MSKIHMKGAPNASCLELASAKAQELNGPKKEMKTHDWSK
jgi:hypothetical protein